jgi:hypothetical protein
MYEVTNYEVDKNSHAKTTCINNTVFEYDLLNTNQPNFWFMYSLDVRILNKYDMLRSKTH